MPEYNGWINRETWLANMHFDEMSRECFEKNLSQAMASGKVSIFDLREHFIASMELAAIGACPGIDDFRGLNLENIDWNDIFSHLALDSEAAQGQVELNGEEWIVFGKNREELNDKICDILDSDLMKNRDLGDHLHLMTQNGPAMVFTRKIFQEEEASLSPSM